MLQLIYVLLGSLFSTEIIAQEQAEHRNFQYQSAIDPLTGRYNFAYDTGNDNDIAHSLHMQYQDADGMVRGRYGYTDPRGKLRMVEYEAGPNGFIARGDVGVDMALHDNAPAITNSERPVASYQEGDFLLDPAPVQMAGWNPESNPMGTSIGDNPQNIETVTSVPESESVSYINPFDRSLFPGYPSVNVTSNNPIIITDPSSTDYNERYPRISYSAVENSDGSQTESEAYRIADTQLNSNPDVASGNINIIDSNPEEIRKAVGNDPNAISADSSITTASERVQRQVSTRPVKVTTPDGRRLFYRDSHSNEPHEHYYYGPNHDHDSETRYNYRPRQTHDHNSERRYYRTYYRPRQTHDHDNERQYYRTYYRPRQTHDHDAERRYRQTHDHAERYNYYGRVYRNGRVYYIDRHSKVPHAHTSDNYQSDHDHTHSDVHLYARYRNSDYPATAKPRQLQYIPSDRYHDKDYYWTNSS